MIAMAQRNSYALRCEWLALWLITLCAFFIPITVALTTITYLCAWFLILISGNWKQRFQQVLKNPVAISFWILFGLFLLGLTYSASPWYYALKDLHKRHWLLITPFFMMLPIDDHWRNRIINAFLCAMLVTLFFSYLKCFFGVDLYLTFVHKTLSFSNVFFEHLVQNFFMSIAAFICGYRFFNRSTRRWIYFTLFVAMLVNVLFLNDGRTGHIVFLLLLMYLAYTRFGWRGIIISGICSVILFSSAYVFSSHLRSSVTTAISEYHMYHQGNTITSIGQRVGMLHNARTLIKKHPWIGYGTGGIRIPMQQNLTPNEINLTRPLDYVENSMLNFWLEFGIFGLIIFLVVIGWQVKLSFSLPGAYKHIMQAFLLAYIAGSMVNSFFVSFCETHLYSLLTVACFSALVRIPQLKELQFPSITENNYAKIKSATHFD
jgi:O-antigen ligase